MFAVIIESKQRPAWATGRHTRKTGPTTPVGKAGDDENVYLARHTVADRTGPPLRKERRPEK